MLFKELKEYIFDEVIIVLNKDHIYLPDIKTSDKYDNYEVIGIRANSKQDCLLISLKI